MPRPLTRDQAVQNAAFLRHLRRTGNVRLSAREAGIGYGTVQHRRKVHPGVAQRWDAALVLAQARLGEKGLQVPVRQALPQPLPQAGGEKKGRPLPQAGGEKEAFRTAGGEPTIVRVRGSRLQVRRAHPGKLTRACEQAFLLALSATANLALSAAAAGASYAAFDRCRKRNPAFAREWQSALERGYEAVEGALMASWSPRSREHDAWRDNEPPPVPSMAANQALQLMYLHQKEARFHAERRDIVPRPGEKSDAHSARLGRRYIVQLAEEAEHQLMQEVLENQAKRHIVRAEPSIPPLPALDQVTGWSRADQNKLHVDHGRALFGGWRLGHLTEEQRGLGKERLGKARGRRKG